MDQTTHITIQIVLNVGLPFAVGSPIFLWLCKSILAKVKKPDIAVPNDLHDFNKIKHEQRFKRNDETIDYITEFYNLNADKAKVDFPKEDQEKKYMSFKEFFREIYMTYMHHVYGQTEFKFKS